jgi:hypothetical protein
MKRKKKLTAAPTKVHQEVTGAGFASRRRNWRNVTKSGETQPRTFSFIIQYSIRKHVKGRSGRGEGQAKLLLKKFDGKSSSKSLGLFLYISLLNPD